MVPGAQEGLRSLVIWTIPRHRCGRAKDLASQGTASAGGKFPVGWAVETSLAELRRQQNSEPAFEIASGNPKGGALAMTANLRTISFVLGFQGASS